MAFKNPFVTLGLNPDFIRHLADDQIDILVQSAFKALQTIFHPDKPGGNAERSREITDAKNRLDQKNNREGYEAFKAQFLKKASFQSRAEAISRELNSCRETQAQLEQVLLKFLRSIPVGSESLTVFNLPPCTLKIRDYTNAQNISFATAEKADRKTMQEIRDHNFFDLVKNPDGSLHQVRDGKIKPLPLKSLVAAINEESFIDRKGFINILKKIHPSNTARSFDPDRVLKAGKKRVIEKETVYLRNQIEPENFIRLLPFLSPVISRDSYLFSCYRQRSDLVFCLEGHVIDITLNNS